MEMESTLTSEIYALHSTLQPAMGAVESARMQLERARTETEASSLMGTLPQHPDVQEIDTVSPPPAKTWAPYC